MSEKLESMMMSGVKLRPGFTRLSRVECARLVLARNIPWALRKVAIRAVFFGNK